MDSLNVGGGSRPGSKYKPNNKDRDLSERFNLNQNKIKDKIQNFV